MSPDDLDRLRERIRALDEELVRVLGERLDLVLEVGRAKQARGLPVLDPGQEARVVRRAAELSRDRGLDPELTRDVLWRIIAAARQIQEGTSSWGPPDPPEEGG